MTSITSEIARRASCERVGADEIDVRRLVGHCFLDWLGCAVAGIDEESSRIAKEMALDQKAAPVATLVGSAVGTSTLLAAHANGVISHALDFDDANLTMPGHPSVVLFPGLLALAEARRFSGQQVVDAFLAGYDGACRIGSMVAPDHYARGFHATATIGTFASALACGRLIGLDERAMRRAIGIAATQAAGLISMFGTDTKPLHAGNAAANGLRAALLAERGLTSNEDALDCALGFAVTHSADWRPYLAQAVPRLGHHVRDNLFKVHAACYGTHATIECALSVRRARGPRMSDVMSIKLEVGEECVRTCNIASPTNGAQARFSLRFNAALGLLGLPSGEVETYCESNCQDPALVELMIKTEVKFVPGRPLTLAGIRVQFEDGTVTVAQADTSVPNSDLDAQEVILLRKFDYLTRSWTDASAIRCLREAALELDNLEVIGIAMNLLAAGPRLVSD